MLTGKWRIQMFGGFAVRSGERVHSRFNTRKTATLLAYLAYHLDAHHSREVLADMLWPDSDPEASRTNLRVALNSLRRQLEPTGMEYGSVLVAPDKYDVWLNPDAVSTDVDEFRNLLEHRPELSPDERRARLSQAVELYRGDLLPGFYDDWIEDARNQLAITFLNALNELSVTLAESGDIGRALEVAQKAVSENPYEEEAHCKVMELLALSNRPAEVVRHFEHMERLFGDSLQVTPSPAVKSLVDRARGVLPGVPNRPGSDEGRVDRAGAGDRGADAPNPPAEAVGPPPSAAPKPGEGPQTRLPVPLTRFFGREEEMARLEGLIQSGERLVTVTGIGGAGKTRLAVQFAHACADRLAMRAVFVPLADVVMSRLLPGCITEALGVAGTPEAAGLTPLIDELRANRTLLILDNMEQLDDGAGATIQALLEGVPDLVIVATSRTALQLSAEQRFPLNPLPTPRNPGTPERLMEFASVQLFVDRASRVDPDFQVNARNAVSVAELCNQLEGLPLSIELAAGWALDLSPAQMVKRLSSKFELLVSRKRDTTPRHATLQASLDWSYRLLPPHLQRLFAALATFAGGWTSDAAREVCAEPHTLEALADLSARSLITADRSGAEPRYSMLEILREFAASKLSAADQPYLAQRHAGFYADLAAEAEEMLRGPEQSDWIERLAREHDNFRAALHWAAGKDPRLGLRLAISLARFWHVRGHIAEGREWLIAAARAQANRADRLGRANALSAAGSLACMAGDFAAARRDIEQALSLREPGDDDRGLATTLNHLGMLEQSAGNLDAAWDAYERAVRCARACGARDKAAGALANMATIAEARENYDEARTMALEALEEYRSEGDHWSEALILANLGNIACQVYAPAEANDWYGRSLSALAELGDLAHSALVLRQLAAVAAYEERFERAATLAGAAHALQESTGCPLPSVHAQDFQDTVRSLERAMPGVQFETAWASGAAMDIEEATRYALRSSPSARS